MRAVLHLAGNVAPVLTGLVTAPLTARALGPETRGELAVILLIAVLVGLVGAFGLGPMARQAVSEDIGQAHGWSERGRRVTLFSASIAALVGGGIGYALGLSWWETLASIALLALAGMSASKSIDANILIVAGRTKQFGLANLLAAGTIGIGIVVAFTLGWLTLTLVITLNAVALVVQMSYIAIQRCLLLARLEAGQWKQESLKALIPKAWRAWRSQLVEATLLRSDSLLLISQASVTVVGLYAVVALIPQMCYQVFQTLIQHSYATSPRARIRQRTTLLWQFCVLCSLPLAVLGGAAGFLLIPVIFGPAFIPSLELLVPACAMAICLAGLAPVLQHFAISPTGDSWFPVVCLIIAVAAWFVGNRLGSASGILSMAAGFVLASGAYVYLLSGARMFCISSSAFARLFGRSLEE